MKKLNKSHSLAMRELKISNLKEMEIKIEKAIKIKKDDD